MHTAALLTLLCAAQGSSAPLWFNHERLTPQARELLVVLDDAATYGLPAEDYAPRLAATQRAMLDAGGVDPTAQAEVDAALTQAAVRFMDHVHAGRVKPSAAGFDLPHVSPEFDAQAMARTAAAARDVRAVVASIEPRPAPYRLLKQALARYRELVRSPQFATAPPRPERTIAEGDEYAGAEQLRSLLTAVGDLERSAQPPENPALIDAALASAVRRFQRRHGLEQDGVIGKQTYAALATPLAHRVRQIELTLERWRWTSALGRPDIVVNIPQFILYALPPMAEPSGRPLEMPVIVGRNAPHMRTPIFTAQIERVIFQPYWDVPRGILTRELLPLIRKDVGYLERNDMEIVRGAGDDARVVSPTPAAIAALASGELRLRQKPGPKNALGGVKFVLPNPYSVYLHATPAAELFARPRRDFSHGCVRVSDPAALARFVLKYAAGEWPPEAIEAALCGPTTQTIELTKPVRVLMFYSTAAATESEGVLFVNDLYGHDARLERLFSIRRGQ